MTKTSSRNNGCLTQRRRCPCGDEQCYIKVEGNEEDASTDTALPVDPNLMHGPPHTSPDIVNIETPYVGQSFRTDDEAQEYYTNFARRNGFAIRRERSKGNPSHPLGVYKRELVCHRAGVSLPRKTAELKRQRNKKSSRCKCEAQMIIKKNVSKGTSRWVVVQFSNMHNHELLDSDEVRHLPAYRNISSVDRERILYLVKAGCTVNLIMRALEMEKGVKAGQLSFTERDLRNFLQASKNINRENEGVELLKACKAMKDRCPDFRYDFTVDANDKLEHVLWSYPDSIHAYKVFGDVVVFDTTYRLYAYDRPFGVWFGTDNYGNAIFFACVLLQDERPSSFRWALQSLVHLMDGKLPQTLLTDLDLGLKEAIMSELPNTKHAFCSWYIVSKLSSWFSMSLGPHFERLMTEFQRISTLDNLEDFTQQWSQMVSEFGLSSDRHITLLTYNRENWALPFLRGWFFGGLNATGFSTSIKSFFRGFLNSQTRLRDFVEQVATAVDLQNQAAEEATIRQDYQNMKIKTCMPIEEHAASILTPFAFDLFQKELVESTQFAVYDAQRDTYLVQHRLQSNGGHIIQWISSDESIRCSCKEFESSGILCRHALRVLPLKNFFLLPDKYLLPRWRKESSLFPKSTGYKYRSQALRSLASIIIQESSLTKDRFDYAQWHMNKLLSHVRNMPTVDETASDVEPVVSSLDAAVDVTPARSRGRPRKLIAAAEMLKEAQAEVQSFSETQELSEAHELLEAQELP
ncbi:protein FAR1-RELATED SEQUENCE 11-like [Ananas comosus]|uniref:Protein FAR1-RELATED SEQUENCE n=1 Tax=Ananas comosus TaxID=4615 RepID=A0A6P5FUQ9_ANACO|nr:protein FAR1-RELATED SEQUENCE 11-like [Ananas comosus]XP_020099388.1 protein FAR1-RELATED SEQUENCE 11-like [Ananas comosus]XP_020099389.1 protein FAR1-RELATED SEQUENCE 11-like [Ananas comosus]